MSKSVSRSARRRQAKGLSVGCIVSDNLSKPLTVRFDGRPVGKPSTGFVMARGQASSGAFDTKRTQGPRAHDPAGNTFTAKREKPARRDTIVTEQGPMVFSKRAGVASERDRSQAAPRLGSAPVPFQPADYSKVERMTEQRKPMTSVTLERAGRDGVLSHKAAVEAELRALGYFGKVWD